LIEMHLISYFGAEWHIFAQIDKETQPHTNTSTCLASLIAPFCNTLHNNGKEEREARRKLWL